MPRKVEKYAYKLAELSEAAQTKAVEEIRQRLSGPWWDSSDNDEISDVIRWKLAEKLGTPGWDKYGVGDFPGIPGVTLDGWDLDRGQSLAVSGELIRDNAPKLPWVDGVDLVELDSKHNDHTRIEVYVDDDQRSMDDRTEIEQAVRSALHDAWQAGYDEMEYKTSAEYARDMIEANEYEFHEDGRLFDVG